jgi:uncharacterized lipoprotein YmbA
MPRSPQGRLAARALAATIATLALGASGCVALKRTPEARFFVLRSLAEPPAAPQAPAAVRLVGLLPTRIPGYIDRPQLVTWTRPGELRIDEFLRWAEPLDTAITRTLAENLDTLLPETHVVRSPFASGVKPRCRVRVDLMQFGPQADGDVRLEGRYILLPAGEEKPLAMKPVSLRRGPIAGSASDPGVGVEAMSELLGELAREIATAIRQVAPEG